jgi:hypothetical protein
VFRILRLSLYLLIIPFVVVFYLCRLVVLAFRSLWKSNLDPRVKWGITSGSALLFVVISVILSSNQTSTQVVATAPNASIAQAQAAVIKPTVVPTVSVTPTPSPTPVPTPSPTTPPTAAPIIVAVAPRATAPPPPPAAPAFNYCGAPANPWHYNFCAGNVITAVPSSFCSYFPCIPSFWKQVNGYAEECVDGKYSHSGGRQGACSYHAGEMRPLLGP